jgi:hypothetical protein
MKDKSFTCGSRPDRYTQFKPLTISTENRNDFLLPFEKESRKKVYAELEKYLLWFVIIKKNGMRMRKFKNKMCCI